MSATNASSRSSDLLNQGIAKTLVRLTLPMILGLILLMTFGLVDTFFVGLLGTKQLAAISFTFPVTFTVISLNIGLGVGTSAVIAKLLGAGDKAQAKQAATGALMLTLVLALILAIIGITTIPLVFSLLGASEDLLPYIRDYMVIWYAAGMFLAMPMVGNSVLRAAGDMKTPSYVMAMGGLINVVLDPILIFGWGPFPALGIQGAAIATLVGWGAGFFYILYILAVKRQLIEPKLLKWNEFICSCSDILKIGLPAAGANMLTPIATGILTAIIATYGYEAVAAWGVGGRLESIALIVVLSLSMSLPPFVSQNFGANKLDRVEKSYMLSIKFVMVCQLLMYALVALLAPYIANVFSDEAEVVRILIIFLYIVPLGYGLQGITILTNSTFNAMHMPMAALWLNVLRLFVFLVPICYLASVGFGMIGIFWGSVLANLGVALIALVWCKRILNKKLGDIPKSESVYE